MNAERIVLAGGCFWGLQAFLSKLGGVINTTAGYANSRIPDPGYELVCSGHTNAAEAVDVRFDPNVISLRQLLDAYFSVIDPTVLDRQGNDIGSNYRTGIYYVEPQQLPVIERTLATEQKKWRQPILTEIAPLESFWPAEECHQDYLERNPGGYCHIPVSKIGGFSLKSREELEREDRQ